MKRILLFVAGTKGGVGKSFASMAMAGAARDLEIPVLLYDTDNENQTIADMSKDECIYLDESAETYPLDVVINGIEKNTSPRIIIVDMKAGTSRSTQEWFSSVPWDDLRSMDLEIYIVGCVTCDFDSVKTLGPWLEYFNNIDYTVKFILIQNEKDGKDFNTCETILIPLLQLMKLEYSVFNIQAIEQTYITALNNDNLFLRDYLLGKGRTDLLPGIMQKSRLRKHYQRITDPLIEFFFSKIPQEDITSSQQKVIDAVKRRIALSKGAAKKESTPKTTQNEKGN